MKARVLFAMGVVLLGCLAAAPSASANHHFVVISEVYGGDADAGSEFVELQMLAGGQNVFTTSGAEIQFYNATGASLGQEPFTTNPTSGAQRTVLMATGAAALDFGVTPDTQLLDADRVPIAGGAVCFYSNPFMGIDCVSWGNFTGAAMLPVDPGGNADPNEAAIPSGSSIVRTKARGSCATLMDFADDTDDSAADFAPGAPSPTPSATAAETECTDPDPGPDPTPPAKCAGQNATKEGTAGPNVIVGTPGKDVIAALGGNDTIRGLAGNDFLCGGGGRDKLIGGGGRDKLFGQAGRDTCKGGPKRDTAKTCETKRSI